MRKRLLQTGLAVALIATACGDSGNGGLTVGELTGRWKAGGLTFLEFSEDGTYRIALTDNFTNSTVDQGQFTLDGTLFTFISNENSTACDAGQRGNYEVEVLEKGTSGVDRLIQVQSEDECSTRGSTGDLTLVRLS
ncbi:MAG: hypothetical protein OEM22_00785 [Acidimicrobiia bacterium]|nr:hypothetical protein [Acidimicrobiia bacterium]MDH3470158.1 hypothetical protein [Acidimicrobiia bacterium]